MYNYEKLLVWQKSDELAHLIYRVTSKFPKSELFGLASQLRRAGTSVPTNIVEGVSRQARLETRHFVSIALGSLAEVHYLIHFCHDEGLISEQDYKQLLPLRESVGRLLWSFFKSF